MIGDTTSDATVDPIGEAKIDVIGIAISDVIPDNKGFRGFKKCRYSFVFLKIQFWSITC